MHYHLKQFDYHKWLKSEIIEIYMNLAIRSFALSMGGIFIPIYLYNLGFNINLILIYYIITFSSFGFFSLSIPKLGKRIGLKHLIMLSIPFHILFIFLLYILNGVNVSLLSFISFIEGVGAALYWTPLHSLFAKFSQKKKANKQVSYIFSLPGMVSIIGPIVGAFIIFNFGFKVLLIVISLFLFISLIPLFYSEDLKPQNGFSLSLIFCKEHRKFFFGFFMNGILYITHAVMWPLFVFFMLKDIVSIGIIGTIIAIAIVFFPLILARLSLKINLKGLYKIGGIISFLVFGLLKYVSTANHIYLASFMIGTVLIMIEMPFYTMAVKSAAKKNPLEFMIFRESALSIGRVTMLVLLLFFINKFHISFTISSISSLLALVV